jgi:hypothetical protein
VVLTRLPAVRILRPALVAVEKGWLDVDVVDEIYREWKACSLGIVVKIRREEVEVAVVV